MTPDTPNTVSIPGFRRVPRTGVIYVMHRARQQGYTPGDPAWANLGQGMPETGPIPGAPDRIEAIRRRITYLELNVNQDFMNRFSAAKFLPHTHPERFPSVKVWG